MKNLFLLLCVACLFAACSKDDQIFDLNTDTYEDYKENNTIDVLIDSLYSTALWNNEN